MNNTEKKILQIIAESPLTAKGLMKKLNVPVSEKSSFKKILDAMTADGKLLKIKGERYGLAEKMGLVKGRLQGHADGYGFIIPENEGEEDVFVNNRSIGDAMHGDTVVCRVESISKGNKREGTIIRILKRAHTTIVGSYEPNKSFGFVIPEEKRIFQDVFIPRGSNQAGAKKGQVVLVRVDKYPTKNRNPEGTIIDVLGFPSDPDVEVEIVIRKYNLYEDFPEEVISEAEAFSDSIPEKEMTKRLDLRKENIFTIDGENAKDFDDAISIKQLENNHFTLGVHIADVSYYVKEGSAIDDNACHRSTSVYFPDRVIPMLPFRLSNELCSLKPKQDRLTLSIIMEIDQHGEVVEYKIAESVIRSTERMTYENTAKIIQKTDPHLCRKYAHIQNDFYLMKRLCDILKTRRMEEGSIDFDLPEPEIILDLQGKPENIIKIERNIAHRIIEEFMLLANSTVAGHIFKLSIPALYRVHEKPDPVKIQDFNEFIHNLGYFLKDQVNIHPKDLQELLGKVKGTPEERLINNILLRSMKQARYSTNNIGHFGLSFLYYTHFTSPIRRYPDLIIHRLLKTAQKGKISKEEYPALEESLLTIASTSSEMERKAEEAERDIVALKKIQFMEDKVGEVFIGYISGIVSYGIFVELEEYLVEGLIHVSGMSDDYYHYIENQYCLRGENTRKSFRIGDKVKVKVKGVSVEKREIDLAIVRSYAR